MSARLVPEKITGVAKRVPAIFISNTFVSFLELLSEKEVRDT